MQRPDDLPRPWNVAIDAEGDLRAEPVEPAAVTSLVDSLGEHNASVSHRPRMFSTRLTVYATDVLDATQGAMKLWQQAVEEAGLPDWPVTRVETTRTDG